MARRLPWFFIAVLCLVPAPAAAQNGRVAVTGKVGTLGLGADVTVGLSRIWNTRVGFQSVDLIDENLLAEVDWAGSLLFDWHPNGRNFRISGGLSVIREGESVYGGEVDPRAAPYLGLGWGNALRSGSRWNFSIDVGALGAGGGVSYSSVSASRAAPASSAKASSSGDVTVSSPKVYGVISTGLSYRF